MNDTLAHVARGILRQIVLGLVESRLLSPDAVDSFIAAEERSNSPDWRRSLMFARAAIRALAEREPSEEMIRVGNEEIYEPVGVIWRMMTAKLAEECERE